MDTRVADIKRMIEDSGAADGRYSLPAASQVGVLATLGLVLVGLQSSERSAVSRSWYSWASGARMTKL